MIDFPEWTTGGHKFEPAAFSKLLHHEWADLQTI
jgi:hypothetical protein